ncbi:MAG: hypothetical protein KBT73_11790 [Marinobacter sp.]|nr:hypothetical protein [Marinobacter sp.]
MRQTNGTGRRSSEKIVKDIKRATRKQYSSEEKIRIVNGGAILGHSSGGIMRSRAV